MHLWHIFLVSLASLGCLPSSVVKLNIPKGFYIFFAILWTVVFIDAYPMYDWGTKRTRKHGWERMANLRQRLRSKIMPPIRIILLILAICNFISALGIWHLIK